MKKAAIIISSIIVFLLFTHFVLLSDRANEKITLKVSLIEKSLEDSGYSPKWLVISEKRSEIYNSLLPFSAKKSHHLKGNAIDLYILDIDGDFMYTKKDVELLREHNRKVEKKNASLRGAFGTYFKNVLSQRMIHLDTRGKSSTYDM